MNGIQVQTSPTVPVLPLLIKERVGARLLALLFTLFFMACTPPEEPIDTDGSNDNDTPATDIDPNDQINFPDPVLRACVEELTGKGSGDPIYAKDVEEITQVNCDGISDLNGMEYFTGILAVVFYNSSLISLAPLKNLSTMTSVNIEGGTVKTLDDIAELPNITSVLYKNSGLEDIGGLEGKEKLKLANIYGNNIKNIGALASLPSLEKIDASDNPALTTLGAQFTAAKLTDLNVSNCALTSLNELSGLPELASIDAQDNYLTNVSVFKNLPKLKGVAVNGNCLTEEAIQEYVDWFNANDPVIPLTYDDVYSKQDYAKCQ